MLDMLTWLIEQLFELDCVQILEEVKILLNKNFQPLSTINQF